MISRLHTQLSLLITLCFWLGVDGDAISCDIFHDVSRKTTIDSRECKERGQWAEGMSMFQNLPMLTAAHCNTKQNSSSNICKFIAGRFEFKYDVNQDKVLGPIEASQYVNSAGVHERVPISYTPEGEVLTNDRVINWARLHYLPNATEMNLMNVNHFSWCRYAVDNNWPYKSSFSDPKTGGRYKIYFFNRQSCIYDTERKETQHFNTRFLHNSSLRIDLDYNPLMFTFWDPIANDVRLVKNMRQHWYELNYRVIDSSQLNSTGLKYFVLMDSEEKPPCKVNASSGPFIGRNAYTSFSKMCLSNYYQKREGKNSMLLQVHCGYDGIEIVDSNAIWDQTRNKPTSYLSVGLHSIPRYPREAENFYGVDVREDATWTVFAYDGFSFSATTSYQQDNGDLKVFMLYSSFLGKPGNKYDEFYPKPLMSQFTARWSGRERLDGPRERNQKAASNLNYVDDIAYLHKCKTILIVFGPLYQESSEDEFMNLDKRRKTGSISELGLFETTRAFFAKDSSLFFFHRLNYVAEYKYTCGQAGKLVTASRLKYYRVDSGRDTHPMVWNTMARFAPDTVFSEEEFFRKLGVLKSGYPVDAPDPAKYPYKMKAIELATAKDNSWLYYVYAAVALIVLIMLALCLWLMRRGRKHAKPNRGMPVMRTFRSGSSLGSDAQLSKSRRSLASRASDAQLPKSRRSLASRASDPKLQARTARSGALSSTALMPSQNSASTSAYTARSKLPGSSPGSAATRRSNMSAASAKDKSSPTIRTRIGSVPSGSSLTARSSGLKVSKESPKTSKLSSSHSSTKKR